MADKSRAKKVIGGIYSWAAGTVYEPLVVNGAFRVFGRNLNDLVREQGREAALVADGRPILDLPVGTGTFTIAVARATEGLVIGADIAWGMVQQARTLARSAGVRNLEAVRCDAHKLPFPDGAFGAILCTNGLQVMPGLQATLAELGRVLAPDGTLFVSVVNLPISAASTAPTLLMSRRQLKREFEKAGFRVTGLERERLATLLEARLG